MELEGTFLQRGDAKGVSLQGTQVNFLATAAQSKRCSVFEFIVVSGFDTGVHYHTQIEEFFYVIEGQLTFRVGERVVDCGQGASVFVPIGAPHSFANRGTSPARMLVLVLPSGHEHYFEELAALLATGTPPEPAAIAALRLKYDTVQVSTLTATK